MFFILVEWTHGTKYSESMLLWLFAGYGLRIILPLGCCELIKLSSGQGTKSMHVLEESESFVFVFYIVWVSPDIKHKWPSSVSMYSTSLDLHMRFVFSLYVWFCFSPTHRFILKLICMHALSAPVWVMETHEGRLLKALLLLVEFP